jgi:hypothetical protein
LVYESFLAGSLSSRHLFHLTLMVARAHNATFVALSVSNMLNSPRTYHCKVPPQISPQPCACPAVNQRLHDITPEARLSWLPQVQERSPQSQTCQRRREGSVSGLKLIHGFELTYDSCDKKARDPDLLRLPPEVRMMIWGYALGGQTIKLAPKTHSPHRATQFDDRFDDRFPLLRVAQLPYTRNTFSFHDLQDYFFYAGNGLIKHAQYITVLCFHRALYYNRFPNFPKVHARFLKTIEVLQPIRTSPSLGNRNTVPLPLLRVKGVSVNIRFVDYREWVRL